jgi:hypothetical protein
MAEEQPDRASTADDALALQTGSTSVVSSDANAPADSLMDNKKRRRESSPLQEFQHEPPNKRRFDHQAKLNLLTRQYTCYVRIPSCSRYSAKSTT